MIIGLDQGLMVKIFINAILYMKKLKAKQFTIFKDQKQIYQLHFSYHLYISHCSWFKLLCLNIFLYGYMDNNNAKKHDSSNAMLY